MSARKITTPHSTRRKRLPGYAIYLRNVERASTRKSIDNIELVWRMDPAWLKQFAVFMDRLKDLSVIAKVPEFDKVVVREFVDQVKF